MKPPLKLSLALGISMLAGCTTPYRAEPANFSHLSCEKLRGLYDPTSELLIPSFKEDGSDESDGIAHPTSLGGSDANDYRDEENKFRTDVRAAYAAKGC